MKKWIVMVFLMGMIVSMPMAQTFAMEENSMVWREVGITVEK